MFLLLVVWFFAGYVQRTTAPAPPSVVAPTGVRTNFCSRSLQVQKGQISVADALRNRTVTIAVSQDSSGFIMMTNNITGMPTGGFMYKLHQTMATAGGFKIKYVPVPFVFGEEGGTGCCPTPWLIQVLNHVDIFANDLYIDTAHRRSLGLGFTQEILDSSLVLVTTQNNNFMPLDFFSFLLPFSKELWIAVAAVIIFNGFCDYYLHVLSPNNYVNDTFDGEEGETKQLSSSLFVSFFLFTRVDELEMENWPAKWLNVGFSFLILIINATYTANLASVLLLPSVTITKLHSMEEANDLGSKICAWSGTYAAAVIQNKYPNVQLIPLNSTSTM